MSFQRSLGSGLLQQISLFYQLSTSTFSSLSLSPDASGSQSPILPLSVCICPSIFLLLQFCFNRLLFFINFGSFIFLSFASLMPDVLWVFSFSSRYSHSSFITLWVQLCFNKCWCFIRVINVIIPVPPSLLPEVVRVDVSSLFNKRIHICLSSACLPQFCFK